MSDWQFNTIFPVRYRSPEKPAKYDQVIIVNWLQLEVDMKAVNKMPALNALTRWRNKEVYQWVRDHSEEYYIRYFGVS